MTKLDTRARNRLPVKEFAFPDQRKVPLENASHVRNAAARLAQVEDVSEDERNAAWRRIRAAANRFGVTLAPRSSHSRVKS